MLLFCLLFFSSSSSTSFHSTLLCRSIEKKKNAVGKVISKTHFILQWSVYIVTLWSIKGNQKKQRKKEENKTVKQLEAFKTNIKQKKPIHEKRIANNTLQTKKGH